jgi:ubiquinone/menaquinone biosynthesis C-methylase UbiE
MSHIPKTDAPTELAGSDEVRQFYDSKGWKEVEPGKLMDQALFGDQGVIGEIRCDALRRRLRRVRAAFDSLGGGMNFTECGCGGNPALHLADLCTSFTAVDFSTTGLAVARDKLVASGVATRLAAADLCRLPFADATFDAAYSAHALYHIPDAAAQGRAFDEIMRIVRPGGVAVFILVNPRPLAFPGRLLRRLIADTPGLANLADRLRHKPPLPYRPMPLSWMRHRLKRFGSVEISAYALPSRWFNQHVSERKPFGRVLWKIIRYLEGDHPGLAALVGNYVLIRVQRR